MAMTHEPYVYVHITTVSEDGGPTCASETEGTRPNRRRSIGSRMSRATSDKGVIMRTREAGRGLPQQHARHGL